MYSWPFLVLTMVTFPYLGMNCLVITLKLRSLIIFYKFCPIILNFISKIVNHEVKIN